MARVGLCGGTYDPFHNGHSALVQAVLDSNRVDRVIVIPSGHPPHKTAEQVSMAGYRYEMAYRALSSIPHVSVSDIEILRSGPSYTLDTARQLKDLQPDDTLYLVYGSDVLSDIECWHQPLDLLASFPLLIANREGIADGRSREKAEKLNKRFGARITFFPAPLIDLSSTMIRQTAKSNRSIECFVPEPVNRFIHTHQLYRKQDEQIDISQELWDQLRDLERMLWPMLSKNRLIHSLNVMRESLVMAHRYGVSPEQAGKAALLHDCAKCLPQSEQEKLARKTGDILLSRGSLAHGPAGRILAEQRFGIKDPDVLHAIHFHTTGCPEMTALDQIIFIADKIEPARSFADLEPIRVQVANSLNDATYSCLIGIDAYVQREQLHTHPYAEQALREIKMRMKDPKQHGTNDK
jgi:nicotinate-nucleotide adenylyltransferase